MTEAAEEVKENVTPDGDNGSPLSGIANKKTLVPVLTTAAAAAAAGLAATKGPDLLKKISGEANHRAEELGSKAAEGAKKDILYGSGGAVDAWVRLLRAHAVERLLGRSRLLLGGVARRLDRRPHVRRGRGRTEVGEGCRGRRRQARRTRLQGVRP